MYYGPCAVNDPRAPHVGKPQLYPCICPFIVHFENIHNIDDSIRVTMGKLKKMEK